jgi:broad specificity phosphatase PhoE
MVTIIFESHSTTLDNEKHIASGHNDVALSPSGEAQAKALGKRRAGDRFDAIFCSDLQRSYNTAHLAFGNTFPIIKDARLRESDYGEFEHKPNSFITAERPKRLDEPFPGGESFRQTSARMKSFLQDLLKNYGGKKVMIIGHRATWFGVEEWANHRPLPELLTTPWSYQPGWDYTLTSI